MKHKAIDPAIEQILAGLRSVPPPDPARQAALRAETLAQAERARLQATAARSKRRRAWRPAFPARTVRTASLPVVQLAAIVLLVVVTGTAGLAYAADASAPGDALYGLDRTIEAARLQVTVRPAATVRLLLANASERLTEAEAVAAGGDEERLRVAWDGYGAAIQALMHAVEAPAEGHDGAAAGRVEEALAVHAQRWTGVLSAARQPTLHGTIVSMPAVDPCPDGDLQEAAAHLAWHYRSAYEDVANWICQRGHGPGEVVLAIEMGQAAGVPAGKVLTWREAGAEWGAIYRECVDQVHGREEPGPREDTGAPVGDQVGGDLATPGAGEQHGQGPATEESPGAGDPAAGQDGGRPEDAGNPAHPGTPPDGSKPGMPETPNADRTPGPGRPAHSNGTPTPVSPDALDGTPRDQQGRKPGGAGR